MRRAGIVVIAAMALAGCPKTAPTGDDAGVKAGTGASADAGATAPPNAGASEAGAGAAAGKSATFSGKYTVTAGTMYLPAEKDWASVKFKNDETKMLGDGEMTLTIDPSGRVSGGTEGGPLGASVVDGSVDKDQLTATIRRKDPADEGLSGTLVATIAADALTGTMKLADANAAVVREAKLDAKKK